jgi:hypothetical protein
VLTELLEVQSGPLPEVGEALVLRLALGVDVEARTLDGVPSFELRDQLGRDANAEWYLLLPLE